jgi:hypothetical protein
MVAIGRGQRLGGLVLLSCSGGYMIYYAYPISYASGYNQ